MNCRRGAARPVEPCPKVRQRVAFDQGRGKTTSEAALDYIRRTCSCDHCAANRAAAKAARA